MQKHLTWRWLQNQRRRFPERRRLSGLQRRPGWFRADRCAGGPWGWIRSGSAVLLSNRSHLLCRFGPPDSLISCFTDARAFLLVAGGGEAPPTPLRSGNAHARTPFPHFWSCRINKIKNRILSYVIYMIIAISPLSISTSSFWWSGGPTGLWRHSLYGPTYSKSWRVAWHWRHKLAEVLKIPPVECCCGRARLRASPRPWPKVAAPHAGCGHPGGPVCRWRMSSFRHQLPEYEAGSW